MKYSVIVPIHNGERYLDKCIESVLMQTLGDFELILIDDGSCDSSPEIIEDYVRLDARIRAVFQNNRGPFSTRIHGVELSKGDYVAFLDCDDMLASNALSEIDRVLETNKVDLVVFEYARKRDFSDKSNLFLHDGDALFACQSELAFLRNAICSSYGLNSMCTKVVRSSLLRGITFDQKLSAYRYAEDMLQSLEIVKRIRSAYYLNSALYYYRSSEGSSTVTYRADLPLELAGAYARLCDAARLWDGRDSGTLYCKATTMTMVETYRCLEKAIDYGTRQEAQTCLRTMRSSGFLNTAYCEADAASLRIDIRMVTKLVFCTQHGYPIALLKFLGVFKLMMKKRLNYGR